MDEADIL